MIVVGVDPGVQCGVAVFNDDKLEDLWSGSPAPILELLSKLEMDVVVIEDARLQSHNWHVKAGMSRAQTAAIGSSVGMNKGVGFVIIDVLQHACVPVIALSPFQKGPKITNSAAFGKAFCWTKLTNQHQRDAATVVRAAKMQLRAIFEAHKSGRVR